MKSELQEAILKGAASLIDCEKRWKADKAHALAEKLQNLEGTEPAVKMIREKGLPKGIYVSSDIPQEVISGLSFFAPVYQHRYLDHRIVFAWNEDYNAFESNFSEIGSI